MHASKLELFAVESPTLQFPSYTSLTVAECDEIQSRLASHLQLAGSADGLAIVMALEQAADPVPHMNALDEDFDLNAALAAAGVRELESVLINWHRFDDIDAIGRDDAVRHFLALWYPTAEAIDFFDASCRWVVSIGYEGEIRIANFDGDGAS